MSLLEDIFPSIKAKRLMLEAESDRNQIFKQLAEAELRQMYSNPSLQEQGGGSPSLVQGNPWQFDLATMTIDQAWRQGFPFADPQVVDDAYIAHDDTYRENILKLCRTLYSNHPTAKGVVNTALAFICGGSAWTIEPAPKVPETFNEVQPVMEDGIDPLGLDPEPINTDLPPPEVNDYRYKDIPQILDVDLTRELRRRWKRYCKRGVMHPQMGWIQFWREAVKRKLRDGEAFIYLGVDRISATLAPRFLDPLDIVTPLEAKVHQVTKDGKLVPNQDTAGVRVDPEDPARILGYWWRQPGKQTPILIPAHRILHMKHGVDSDIRRGLPAIYVVRQYLKHFDTWLFQALKHHKIQTMIAMLRQWENTTPDAVRAFVDKNALLKRQYNVPTGNTRTWQTMETLPVVDAPAGMKLTYTTPNSNFADSEILVRRILLAVATGVQQSEAMVSGDASNANYSSTRISQLIPLKTFEAEQGAWAEYVVEFYEKWTKTEVAIGHIKCLKRIEDDSQLDCNVSPPRLPNFEAEMVIGYVTSAMQAGLVSERRAMEMIGENPDAMKEQKRSEEIEESEHYGQAPIGPGGIPGMGGLGTELEKHDPNTGQFIPKEQEYQAELERASKQAATVSAKGPSGNGYKPDERKGEGQ